MPARSSSQRRYLNWRFGHEWVKKHHFDNKGKLPAHAAKKKKGKAMKKNGPSHLSAIPKSMDGPDGHVGPRHKNAVGHHHKHDGTHRPPGGAGRMGGGKGKAFRDKGGKKCTY